MVSSMDISRAANRLIASAPALLAATTTKERDEVSSRMRPEVDRLIIGVNDVLRSGTAGEAAATIQSLVASLRSNLTELENLVGLRLKTRERLAGLLQAAFQANQETQGLFSPWFEVMGMQIGRSLDEIRKPSPDPQAGEGWAQAGRDLAALIVLDRSAQAAQRGFAAIVDQLVQTATMARSGAFRSSPSSCAVAWMISMPGRRSSTRSCAPSSSIRWGAFARSPSARMPCPPSVARSSI